jgi:hypothetical protein
MDEIVGFVPKSELERLRLIREARAIYDSIFPPTDAIGERPDERSRGVGSECVGFGIISGMVHGSR